MQLGADEEGQFQRTNNIQLNDRTCFSAMVQEDTLSPPTDVRVQMYRVQNHVIHTLPSTISRSIWLLLFASPVGRFLNCFSFVGLYVNNGARLLKFTWESWDNQFCDYVRVGELIF